MSMGNAKKETVVDADGNKRTSRIPQKPLNQFIKAALLTLLKRDDISIKDDIRAGSNTITVLDSNGKYLFMMARMCQRLVTSTFDFFLRIAEMIWLATLSTGITQNRPSPFAIAVSTRPGRMSVT